jgi:hypothetical protein
MIDDMENRRDKPSHKQQPAKEKSKKKGLVAVFVMRAFCLPATKWQEELVWVREFGLEFAVWCQKPFSNIIIDGGVD